MKSTGSGPQVSRGVNDMRVLVAEDDVINQLQVKRVLDGTGHFVHIVSNGLAAVEEMDRARYDVVLMDIEMPVMNGFEAIVEIRKRERGAGFRTPILAVTSLEFGDIFQRFGFNGFLGKPVSRESLLAALDQATKESTDSGAW